MGICDTHECHGSFSVCTFGWNLTLIAPSETRNGLFSCISYCKVFKKEKKIVLANVNVLKAVYIWMLNVVESFSFCTCTCLGSICQ